MNRLTAKRLAAVAALVSFLSLPALADRAPREGDCRDGAIAAIVRVVKRLLRFGTTSDFPTVPKP